ncbi:MAG: Calcineurin-like phosphoesterase [Firmicutes bacterium ADurb.Bin300]|nr:MAG: Calcineurin-like phosphoesterase [Firmicutes bacterium ADurb.Bin300]
MENLAFKNGQFTVMQVSDAQDMHVVRKAMVTMLERAYNKVKPDLVLFTGDNILGNHLRDARFGSKQVIFDKAGELTRMKVSLKNILQPVSDLKIPFAFLYGNHDDRNLITKEEQADIYMSYPYCVPFNRRDKSVDCDTYYIPIFGENGAEKLGIFMLDCAWYDKEENLCYEMITPKTVRWFCEESERQRERNGGSSIPSFLFTHIPLPVTESLFVKCEKDDPDAVRSRRRGGYFKLDKAKAQGFAFGYPSVLSSDSGLFEEIKAQGNIKAVVFGHDHKNRFTASLDGIDIIQTPGASFRCFGNDLRGVRVFVFKEDDINSYETYTLTYFDLIKPTITSRLRYIWDADDKLGKIRL